MRFRVVSREKLTRDQVSNFKHYEGPCELTYSRRKVIRTSGSALLLCTFPIILTSTPASAVSGAQLAYYTIKGLEVTKLVCDVGQACVAVAKLFNPRKEPDQRPVVSKILDSDGDVEDEDSDSFEIDAGEVATVEVTGTPSKEGRKRFTCSTQISSVSAGFRAI